MDILYLGSIYLAGLFLFFSPCVFPIIPVYISVLERGGKKLKNTIFFLLGLSFTFFSLGFGVGILTQYIYSDTVRILAGLLVVIFGLQQYGLFNIKALNKTKLINIKTNYKNPTVESFLLGLSFSLGWTPCIGPILATILLYVGDSGPAYGSVLLVLFILGFATPFVIFTLFYEKLSSKLGIIRNNLDFIKKLGAILIIFLGLGLMFNKFAYLTAFFTSLSL